MSENKDELKPEISFEDFVKADLRVGTVLSAEKVEKSKKLIKMQVSFGSFQRQIVAGIGEPSAIGTVITPESLVGMNYLFVINLAPRVMKIGKAEIESHGMMLAADAESGIALFIPQRIDVKPGAPVH